MLTRTEPLTDPHGTGQGLAQFATMPEWLSAIAEPSRIEDAISCAVPEFMSGELRLLDCRPKRVRLKSDGWSALYQLKVQVSAGSEGLPQDGPRLVTLRGTLLPPGTGE